MPNANNKERVEKGQEYEETQNVTKACTGEPGCVLWKGNRMRMIFMV